MKIKKAGLLTKIILAALALYAIISLISYRTKESGAQAARDQLESQVQSLEEENAGIRYAIGHSTDPEVIKDIARNKLGLVLPGEKIFYDVGD